MKCILLSWVTWVLLDGASILKIPIENPVINYSPDTISAQPQPLNHSSKLRVGKM